jgi:hypothetical protein
MHHRFLNGVCSSGNKFGRYPIRALLEPRPSSQWLIPRVVCIWTQCLFLASEQTCKNFAELARRGYYNGVIFHRIISVRLSISHNLNFVTVQD